MKTQKITLLDIYRFIQLVDDSKCLSYLNSDAAKRLCAHFGFPDYFRVELACAKIIGANRFIAFCP